MHFYHQEYLEYQRQLALQRMQDQERERQMRFEQQKQMQHMRAMQTYYPQVTEEHYFINGKQSLVQTFHV